MKHVFTYCFMTTIFSMCASEPLQILQARLEPIGAWYREIPDDNAPLDEDKVMNNFWRSMKDKSQEEKDKAFKKYALKDSVFGARHNRAYYNMKRYQIAAGVYAGANPKLGNVLNGAVWRDDYPLVELLLQHKADPNIFSSNVLKDYPITLARNKKMAQLLVAYGASVQSSDCQSANLLDTVLTQFYQPKLIGYYISLGVKYDQTCKYGNPCLYLLMHMDSSNFIKYTKACLKGGVPSDYLISLLKKGLKKYVSQRIEQNYASLIKLIAIIPFNQETDCLICFAENIDKCVIPCPHADKHSESICTACLARIKDCPLCRTPLK